MCGFFYCGMAVYRQVLGGWLGLGRTETVVIVPYQGFFYLIYQPKQVVILKAEFHSSNS